MPTHDEWSRLITERLRTEPPDLTAATFDKKFGTNARPVRVFASNGRAYVVKSLQDGHDHMERVLVNEQVVSTLGKAIGAPVASVALISVPKVLIDAEPEMTHMDPGVAHASLWLDNCTEREGLKYVDVGENRNRFAALAILYSWIHANDHQFLYAKAEPHLVYSVDHGHFFPGGPSWTVDRLKAERDPVLDAQFDSCDLSENEYGVNADKLGALAPSVIAEAVAQPWHEWPITLDERIELADYLEDRRLKLVDKIAPREEAPDG